MEYPCNTCQYSETPYVCEQSTCDKYKSYKSMSLYEELGEIAKQTVIRTMIEGEKTHPANGWSTKSIANHTDHAIDHISNFIHKDTSEDHIAHALTRLTMIEYLKG